MVQVELDDRSDGVEWIDVDLSTPGDNGEAARADRPSARSIIAVLAVLIALVGAFALGRSDGGGSDEETADQEPFANPIIDTLGEGEVIGELDLLDGTRAVLWCRESVPGTRIPSTLALLHIDPVDGLGDQLVSYEELTTPWIPTRGSWRGGQVDLEGFAASSGAIGTGEPENDAGNGDRCATCAPETVSISTGQALYGTCLHGVPFGAGIAYVVASPTAQGQTPLAIHLNCGITSLSLRDDRFVVEAEVPLMRGLTDARFRLPSVSLSHADGRFWADDLGMLGWVCDTERSTQLGDGHLLREVRAPEIDYDTVESAVGPIGVHGELLVGLDRDQCSQLTRAWWGAPPDVRDGGRPVADLVDLDPPSGVRDWVYTCQPE